MKVKIFQDLKLINKKWRYSLKFSDNVYTMIYKSFDICKCLKIQAIMDNRINKFFKRESNILKTSDMGFQYIR